MVRLWAGRVDIPAVIAAAKAKGVSHFIIEDESPNAGSQPPRKLAGGEDSVVANTAKIPRRSLYFLAAAAAGHSSVRKGEAGSPAAL